MAKGGDMSDVLLRTRGEPPFYLHSLRGACEALWTADPNEALHIPFPLGSDLVDVFGELTKQELCWESAPAGRRHTLGELQAQVEQLDRDVDSIRYQEGE